ncbi:MAG TPA: hypothetical protein VGC58_03160 [Candidatus Paceibacterota bacterium]
MFDDKDEEELEQDFPGTKGKKSQDDVEEVVGGEEETPALETADVSLEEAADEEEEEMDEMDKYDDDYNI